MKTRLLASTALVGVVLSGATAAKAGNVSSNGAYSVNLGGVERFSVGQYDHDNSTGSGRGYGFASPVSELWVNARAQADNGVKYGVDMEIEAGGGGGASFDEVYAIIEEENWGRIELGNQDGAANRMMIQGHNALVADGGYFGGLGMWQFTNDFGNVATMSLSDYYDIVLSGGDAAKMIYFSPRIAGFQLGASLMPDSGVTTRLLPDNIGNISTLWEAGANYIGDFGDVRVIVAGTWRYSDDTDGAAPTNTANADFDVWNVGALLTWQGFSLAGAYQDYNDTFLPESGAGSVAAGFEAGQHWNLGIGYREGPWGVSIGYQYGWRDIGSGAEADLSITVLGAQYSLLPGWLVTGEFGLWQVDNGPGTPDNDKQVFMISNMFVF